MSNPSTTAADQEWEAELPPPPPPAPIPASKPGAKRPADDAAQYTVQEVRTTTLPDGTRHAVLF